MESITCLGPTPDADLADYKDVFRKFTPSKGYPALDPISPRKGRHNSRWGLLVNFELDPKRWMY